MPKQLSVAQQQRRYQGEGRLKAATKRGTITIAQAVSIAIGAGILGLVFGLLVMIGCILATW